MVAHYHGQVWSSAEPARSLGVSESTVRRYLDFLTDAYLVRQLQPWFENIGKRQVKSPKVYVRDSGLLHSLLGLFLDVVDHLPVPVRGKWFVTEVPTASPVTTRFRSPGLFRLNTTSGRLFSRQCGRIAFSINWEQTDSSG